MDVEAQIAALRTCDGCGAADLTVLVVAAGAKRCRRCDVENGGQTESVIGEVGAAGPLAAAAPETRVNRNRHRESLEPARTAKGLLP
jgi:hypothetical protein